jgi:hypothetical protein
VEESASCVIDREVDRVYAGKASSEPLGPIRIEHNSTTATDTAGAGDAFTPLTVSVHAELDSTDSSSILLPHDIVLWNPWVDKSRALTDLGDDDYHSFVCVEPGVVADWVDVPPRAALTLTQTLKVADA